jgi:molybdopterin biosynthesis enzyme MoaB
MRPAATFTFRSMSTARVNYAAYMTNLAAANHEDQLVTNLPGEHKGAAALDFRELGHGKECVYILSVRERVYMTSRWSCHVKQ